MVRPLLSRGRQATGAVGMVLEGEGVVGGLDRGQRGRPIDVQQREVVGQGRRGGRKRGGGTSGRGGGRGGGHPTTGHGKELEEGMQRCRWCVMAARKRRSSEATQRPHSDSQ